MTGSDQPSEWARERFGDAAAALRREIPAALLAAHERAFGAYAGLEVQTNEAYGLIWLAQHEELVARLRGIEGAQVHKPQGARYDLVRIGNVVLYPWRYSDGTHVQMQQAKMELSDIRRSLLALGEGTATDEQLPLDSAAVSDEELEADREQARDDARRLAANLRMVLIAYASNPRSGILTTEWGDPDPASADGDGRIEWIYHEPLPVLMTDELGGETGGAQTAPLYPVAPTGGNGAAANRFDAAPMEEPLLTSKTPLTSVDSEQQGKTPETGTNNEEH